MGKLLTLTQSALDFLKESLNEEGAVGMRIDVVSGGCSGMTYQLNFVKEIDSSDVLVDDGGVKIYVASRAVIFVSGMVVNYVKSPMGGNIVFENPNASSKCGCGKSFCMDDSTNACIGKCCS
ncbi:MAG: iron-sulfur cluster assembly accessory protein [Holosporaceae bacterium]|jgi:iron-sulfur cluster assembly protein|nr:iron-sulfur cluster assembly accessory protein [Holosporaceae bacterium]